MVLKFPRPVDTFKFIIDGEVVQHIVNCTNERAAAAFLGFNPRRKINGILWHPVDINTIYIFFGLCLVMGVLKMPRIAWYWSHDVMFEGPDIFC